VSIDCGLELQAPTLRDLGGTDRIDPDRSACLEASEEGPPTDLRTADLNAMEANTNLAHAVAHAELRKDVPGNSLEREPLQPDGDRIERRTRNLPRFGVEHTP
jgi:hypothetical protein